MISFSFCLVLSVGCNLSKIGSLVMRGKINHNLFVITSQFLFILLHTSLNYYIHKLILLPLLVNLMPRLKFHKTRIIKYLPPLLYIFIEVPLFKMRKNLLKHNIFSNRSIFLFPDGNLYSSRIVLIFSKDCISISFKISLTEGISIGGFYFNLCNSLFILFFIISNLLL